MKRQRKSQNFLFWVLVGLVILFCSVFFRTCFSEPVQGNEQQEASLDAGAGSNVAAKAPPSQVEAVPLVMKAPAAKQQEGPSMPSKLEVKDEGQPVPEKSKEIKPVSVPEQPKALHVAALRSFVAGVPLLLDPSVVTQQDYDTFHAPQASSSTEEDPFADFYVAGEDDTVAYDDGMYYLSLYINDEYSGDIEVRFVHPDQLVNMTELSNFLSGMLTSEAQERVFAGNPGYLSLAELKARGVDATFDSTAFSLNLNIPYGDLALRILSVSSTYSNKRDRYALNGAVDLKPAKFSWVATTSLFGSMTYFSDFSAIKSQTYTLYINNSLAFLQLGLDFSASLYNISPFFSLGTWTGFHDFIDSNQRLSFGSVGTNLSARTTTDMGIDANIGVKVEKSYNYGSGTSYGNQFEYTIEVVEPSKVEIYINDKETPVFSRDLIAGTYRLKDFVFTQGANKIKVKIIPGSRPDAPEVYYVDTSYDSRLLGRGDSLYGYGWSMPRGTSSTAGGAFHIKDFIQGTYLNYYPQYSTFRYWASIGLTDTFTLSTDFSATPGVFSGTLNGVFTTLVGTTQVQVTSKFSESYLTPLFNGTVTERFNESFMHNTGSLSLSLNFVTPSVAVSTSTSNVLGSIGGAFSFSGKGLLTKLRYVVSGSATYVRGDSYPTWSASASTGFVLFKGLSLSGSITISAADSSKPWNPVVSATMSGSYSFSSKANGSVSTTLGTEQEAVTSVGISYRPTGNDSLSLSATSFRFSNPLDHSLLAAWTHTGKVGTLTLRQQFSEKYKSMTTSMNLMTSFAFADGVFGMSHSVGDVYMLVRPEGELTKSQISVAKSMDSSPQLIPKYLGSSLYSGLSSYVKNNVVVYGGGSDAYSTGASFMYQFTPRGRQAYVAHIDLPATFTVSGIMRHKDGSPYDQYSSPIYEVTFDTDGKEILTQNSELYLFTDQEGRYIISSIPEGDYSFDVQIDDTTWYAVRFTVPHMEDKKLRVLELSDYNDAGPYDEYNFEGYEHTLVLHTDTLESEEDFWNRIFPPVE
ncbi:MAG: hypothetical protein WCR02_02570 [Sphaerochaetaceae bacterium]